MVRKSSNSRHAMNMVIMHTSVPKEKRNIKEDLDQENPGTVYMLMKKKKRKNLIKAEVKMNWDLWLLRKMILIGKLEKKVH